MSTGAWYHVFVTRSAGNSVRVWLNGTESSSGGQTGSGAWTIDRIGRRAGATFFDGAISQVRLWDSDESAAVATWYAEGVSAAGHPAMRRFGRRHRPVEIGREGVQIT
jgi:hypothetical protein